MSVHEQRCLLNTFTLNETKAIAIDSFPLSSSDSIIKTFIKKKIVTMEGLHSFMHQIR